MCATNTYQHWVINNSTFHVCSWSLKALQEDPTAGEVVCVCVCVCVCVHVCVCVCVCVSLEPYTVSTSICGLTLIIFTLKVIVLHVTIDGVYEVSPNVCQSKCVQIK